MVNRIEVHLGMKRFVSILLCAWLALGPLSTIAATGESALPQAPAWHRIAGENVTVLAASADGTRFLLCEVTSSTLGQYGRELDLHILDTATGESRELYFRENPYLELLAQNILQMYARRFLSQASISEEESAKLIERYGSKAALVMRCCWSVAPVPMAAHGDYILLQGFDSNSCVRVDVRTGETVLFFCSYASMAQNGSVLYRDCDTKELRLLRPDATEPVAYSLQIENAMSESTMCLLSDDSVWLIEKTAREEQPEVEGRPVLLHDVSFVHYGADGRELRRVSAGGFDYYSHNLVTLRYSEQTGVGVAYNLAMFDRTFVWTFGEGDDTAKALMPSSLEPLALCRVERDQAVDELGHSITDTRSLIPLGLSADEKRFLLYDVDSENLLALDLLTLHVDSLLTREQLEALYEERAMPAGVRISMLDLNWNGGDFLCGRTSLGGYVLKIPYLATFGNP